MVTRPSDYRLTFGGEDFFWSGERRPGFPVLRWPCGAICEPVLAYFGHSVEKGRVAISSMKDEAYVLREWLAFMASHGLEWHEADDTHLQRWRQSFEAFIKSKTLKKGRVERKLQVVFDFYRLIDKALPFTAEGRGREPFVGDNCPITSKVPITGQDNARLMWSGSEWVSGGGGKRPTPDEAQVTRILTWLRTKSFRGDSRRVDRNAGLQRELEGERNWLLGRCAAESGLRAHELAKFAVGDIATALERAGVVIPPEGLDRIAEDAEKRGVLLGALDKLEGSYRENVFVDVVGKGRKPRRASFSVELVRELLEIGVWTVRHRQLAQWGTSERERKHEGGVFLSFVTRRSLTAGAVGDLLKGAFRACGVKGSGHRLRAYYATMTAVRLLDLNVALNGYRYDESVKSLTLVQVAEALGHASITTTIIHYVNMAVWARFGNNKKTRNSLLKELVDTIMRCRPSLPLPAIKLLTQMTEALATAADDSRLPDFLTTALSDPRLVPPRKKSGPGTTIRRQPTSALHLVE